MSDKRLRLPRAKPGELKAAYGKERGDDPAILYCYGGAGAKKGDSYLVAHFFENVRWPDDKNFVQELEARGYDISTLKFSIQQKVKAP